VWWLTLLYIIKFGFFLRRVLWNDVTMVLQNMHTNYDKLRPTGRVGNVCLFIYTWFSRKYYWRVFIFDITKFCVQTRSLLNYYCHVWQTTVALLLHIFLFILSLRVRFCTRALYRKVKLKFTWIYLSKMQTDDKTSLLLWIWSTWTLPWIKF
jgi:hypothetical protein